MCCDQVGATGIMKWCGDVDANVGNDAQNDERCG